MIHTSTSTYWLLKNYNHRKKEICISVSNTLSKELLEAVAQNLQLTKVCFTTIFTELAQNVWHKTRIHISIFVFVFAIL